MAMRTRRERFEELAVEPIAVIRDALQTINVVEANYCAPLHLVNDDRQRIAARFVKIWRGSTSLHVLRPSVEFRLRIVSSLRSPNGTDAIEEILDTIRQTLFELRKELEKNTRSGERYYRRHMIDGVREFGVIPMLTSALLAKRDTAPIRQLHYRTARIYSEMVQLVLATLGT